MKLQDSFWQRLGSVSFFVVLAFGWLMLIPTEERSSAELSSETSAYSLYLQGDYHTSYDLLMRRELERRALSEFTAATLERLILDLYMQPSLKLSAQKAADAFSVLLSRSDAPSSRRNIWETYEEELLILHRENYSSAAFVHRVEGLQEQRKATASERPLNRSALQRINESFRIYFVHALKMWYREKERSQPNLRWLYAAGYAGSMYYAQGQEQLEEFVSRCGQRAPGACSSADLAKAQQIIRLLSGLDEEIGEETP